MKPRYNETVKLTMTDIDNLVIRVQTEACIIIHMKRNMSESSNETAVLLEANKGYL